MNFSRKSILLLPLFLLLSIHNATYANATDTSQSSHEAIEEPTSTKSDFNQETTTENLKEEEEEDFAQMLTSEEEQQFKVLLSEELDKLLEKGLKQLQNIDLVLEDLALVVQNNLVKTDNKAALLDQIKSFRKYINKIRNNAFAQVDPETVSFILLLIDALAEHINKAIKAGLEELPDFDPETIFTKLRPTSLEQIEQKIEENEKICQDLDARASNVGLKWYNKIYRFFMHYNHKAMKYSLWSRGFKISVAALFGGYLLYRFTPYGEKMGLGEAPRINANGVLVNPDKIGRLGKMDVALAQWTLGFTPIGMFTYKYLKGALKREWRKLRMWSKKRALLMHYKMLGGVAGKKAQREYDSDKPRFTFDDVVGLDYVKKELNILVKYIEHSTRFERANIVPEKGYIFTGPPGTGKTFIAEALAGEIRKMLERIGKDKDEFKFYRIDAETINTEGIDNLLYLAQNEAPCIIFIDEIDLLGLQRTEDREKLSKFLESMSGYLSNNYKKQVILIAATNSPQHLDVALMRFGRFGKKCHFKYPTLADRKEYLRRRLSPIVADIDEFDIDKIARETEGCTAEALKAIIRNAFQNTKIKAEPLTQKDLENALNEEVRHIINSDSINLSTHELQVIAAQQAACALASIKLNPSQKLACVTVKPTMKHIEEQNVWDRYYAKKDKEMQYGGMFTYHNNDSLNIDTHEDQLSHCKINLAGPYGEELLLGSAGHSYKRESSQMAFNIALSLVSEGLEIEKMSSKIQQKYQEKALALLETCKKEVKQLLEENKETLENLYNALLTYKILDKSQVKQIIETGSLISEPVLKKIVTASVA